MIKLKPKPKDQALHNSTIEVERPMVDVVQIGKMRFVANKASANSSERERILQRSVPTVAVDSPIETSNRHKERNHRNHHSTERLVGIHIILESVLLAKVAKVAVTNDVEVTSSGTTCPSSSNCDVDVKSFTAHGLLDIESTR